MDLTHAYELVRDIAAAVETSIYSREEAFVQRFSAVKNGEIIRVSISSENIHLLVLTPEGVTVSDSVPLYKAMLWLSSR